MSQGFGFLINASISNSSVLSIESSFKMTNLFKAVWCSLKHFVTCSFIILFI